MPAGANLLVGHGVAGGRLDTDDLAAGQVREVGASFAADRQELGLWPAAWLLFRFGAVTLLPDGIKDALRAVRWPDARLLRVSSRLQQEARAPTYP